MVTYEQFVPQYGVCSETEFEIIRAQAKNKLANIISRFGDDDGKRLMDKYLIQLMGEELRAKRVSDILFNDYLVKRVCPVTA